MRVVILTLGSRGDAQPYVALGVGLRAAGHAVRVATHAEFEALVRGHGLDFHPVAGDPRGILATEDGQRWLESGANPVVFIRRMAKLGEPLFRQATLDCLEACRDADLIVFSGLAFLSAIGIAEYLDKPFVPAYLQPVTPNGDFPSSLAVPPERGPASSLMNRLSYLVQGGLFWSAVRGPHNRIRREVLGLEPLPLFMSDLGPSSGVPLLYGYSRHVLPRPRNWGDWIHVTGYWFLDGEPGWQPSADLERFLSGGPPPVYFGFGSMVPRDAARTTELILRALELTGHRGILLQGWGGLGRGDLPASVLPVSALPHAWLFPRVAAVVHHGGFGTTAAGLRAGKPSIVTPFFADQPFWAQRVFALGAGPRPIPFRRLDPDNLARAITIATEDPGIVSQAGTLGEAIRAEDGTAAAVQAIEAYMERGPAPHPFARPRRHPVPTA